MSPTASRPTLSRRRLLGGTGGAFAVALMGGGAAWTARQAFAEDVDGGYIDPNTPAEPFIREQTIRHHTVLQSFCFDDDNGHVYTLQVMQGGIQLPGEPEPVPWEERDANGDLCLTKIDHDATNLGYMYLKGFGHGIACGVEPVDGEAWLWTETDSNPDSGFGRAITTFPFADEQILEYGVDDLDVHWLQPDSTSNQPSIDIVNRRLMLRYADFSSGERDDRYAVYDLDAVKAGDYEPLHDFSRVGIEDDETFQGFTLFGHYAYQMTGTAYTDEDGDNPPSERGNCYLSTIDVRTGELVERVWTQAGYSIPFREPEGLAIQHPSDGAPPRLFMGFAGGVSAGRDISLYYKEQVED